MKLKLKKTPILFFSILLIPWSIIGTSSFLFIDNKGGISLAGVLLLRALVVNLLILLIEQAVLKSVENLKKKFGLQKLS